MNTKHCILSQDVAKSIQTPFYIYDEKAIIENIKKLQDAFSWNKGFMEYFAVKANPIPDLVSIFVENGCGCDCASDTELMIAESLNAKIMFSSNNTPSGEFYQAYSSGAIINLDDISHIDCLIQELRNKVPDTICCRYNCGGEYHVSPNCMDTPEEAKFGMTRKQIHTAFTRLKELGVKNFGLHALLASNALSTSYYPKLAADLFMLAKELKDELDVNISFINLSGGIGIPYLPDEETPDIYAISEGVKKEYENILTPAGMEPAIYTELGRYMLAPFGQLYSKVIHTKEIYKNYIGLDACAVNLLRPAMYGAYHHIIVLGKENQPSNYIYDVTGSLCENNDKFAIDRKLPKVDIGDIVAICDSGAHGSSMGYNYNGRLHCAEYLLKTDGSIVLIKRAQTPEDYFSTYRINPMTKEERWK